MPTCGHAATAWGRGRLHPNAPNAVQMPLPAGILTSHSSVRDLHHLSPPNTACCASACDASCPGWPPLPCLSRADAGAPPRRWRLHASAFSRIGRQVGRLPGMCRARVDEDRHHEDEFCGNDTQPLEKDRARRLIRHGRNSEHVPIKERRCARPAVPGQHCRTHVRALSRTEQARAAGARGPCACAQAHADRGVQAIAGTRRRAAGSPGSTRTCPRSTCRRRQARARAHHTAHGTGIPTRAWALGLCACHAAGVAGWLSPSPA